MESTSIYDLWKKNDSKKDFEEFLKLFSMDYRNTGQEWENNTLDRFIDAMLAYCKDKNFTEPSWKNFAKVLFAAKVYEHKNKKY